MIEILIIDLFFLQASQQVPYLAYLKEYASIMPFKEK